MSDAFSAPRAPTRRTTTRRKATDPATPAPVALTAAPPPPAPPPVAPAAAPAPPPVAAPDPAPVATPVAAPSPRDGLPVDFVTDAEHPVLPIPFTAQVGESRLTGVGLSVAAAYVAIDGPLDPTWAGHREVIRLTFQFDGFGVTLAPEAVVAGSRRPGEMTLQFLDPTGAHLPQLRHIINRTIAGDLVSLGGLLSYAGPVKPKAAKGAEKVPMRQYLRSVAVGVVSLALLLAAGGFLANRATQTQELRPVFIERQGRSMQATAAGQVSYLNPEAKAGEVVFSVNANSGDVLNFQLPCDCAVAVTDGIFEGATVLPTDVILSVFDSNLGVRVQTLMSIEGLAKVMDGDRATLDINDGRSVAVRVEVTSATDAAAMRGDEFVPVTLVPEGGAIGPGDIGKSARLRLSRSWFWGSLFSPGEES